MKSFKRANTWRERRHQMLKVKNKCNEIIGKLEGTGLSEDDPCIEGMIHVRQCCNTIAFVPIQLLKQVECGGKNEIMTILELNASGLKSCLKDLKDNAKISFITIVQFALENCIGRIIEDKTGKKPPFKFKDKCENIITFAGISDIKKVKLNRLMLLAYIRNTLHSGGVHKKKSVTITIQGKRYVLKKDRKVSCATWSHIFFALWHSLEVYSRIFLKI